MLVLLNNQIPDSIAVAVERIKEYAFRSLRLQNYPEKDWDGDRVNVEKQMPYWIETEYAISPNNAPVVDFFKTYYRWLFDYDEGYGCGFYLEDIRDIFYVKYDFLQAYADDVFRGDLDLSVYKELRQNFIKFYICHERDYVRLRGTTYGIEYLLKSLFGVTTAKVVTLSPASIQIESNLDENYQDLVKLIGCPFGFDVTFITV